MPSTVSRWAVSPWRSVGQGLRRHRANDGLAALRRDLSYLELSLAFSLLDSYSLM